MTGTIQPDVLCQNMMQDFGLVDGFWSRFLWTNLPVTEMPLPENALSVDLSKRLQFAYQRLEKLEPKLYRFDREAQNIWNKWHTWCEQEKVKEPSSALRAIYPKLKERAARIALVSHCLNAAAEGRSPAELISRKLLEGAIALTYWSFEQTLLIYSDAGLICQEDASKIRRFLERFQGKGWVSARHVTHWSSPKMRADEARIFMEQVVELGFAESNKLLGRKYKIKVHDNIWQGDSGLRT